METEVTVYCEVCDEEARYIVETGEEGDSSVPHGTRDYTAVDLIERTCVCVLTAQQVYEEECRAAEAAERHYDQYDEAYYGQD